VAAASRARSSSRAASAAAARRRSSAVELSPEAAPLAVLVRLDALLYGGDS